MSSTFQQSLLRDLGRTFVAVLLVLLSVALTIIFLRVLGMATRGMVNPQEIMLVLVFSVLSQLPLILTLTLLMTVVSVLSRMYRDSEMVIWLTSGRSLLQFLPPLVRFSWPIWLVVALLAVAVIPWAQGQTNALRDRYMERGDLQRVEPGQFQESADGRRVFYIDGQTEGASQGSNIFIRVLDAEGRESVTSARSGRLEQSDSGQYLVLEAGQRMEEGPNGEGVRLIEFAEQRIRVDDAPAQAAASLQVRALPTLSLWALGQPVHMAELAWRIGMVLAAMNWIVFVLATAGGNPRSGKGANLAFFLLAFVVYYNVSASGQSWVRQGEVGWLPYLLGLHGGFFVLSLGLLWWRVRR